MNTVSHAIRRLSPSDQPFLWEMLYQSLHVPEGGPPFPREIIHRPDVAKYARAWGRAGDIGFVAVDVCSGQPIGAAWLRLLKGDERGYGYLDDETPELGMAVMPAEEATDAVEWIHGRETEARSPMPCGLPGDAGR